MFVNQDHLRITKVKTIDGTSPLIGPDERPVKKVIFAPALPLTKKAFEDQNTRLPTNLKMKIELVKAYNPQANAPQIDEEKLAMQKKIAELEAKNAELAQNTKNIIVPEKENKTKTSNKPEKEVA